jgi:hypothetical protein
MKNANMPAGATRNANVGLVWEEVITGDTGTIRAQIQGTVRVHALGATTVTIGGVLAMTMVAGMVEYFNVGTGVAGDNRATVEVIIGVAAANVQVAKEIETGRRSR